MKVPVFVMTAMTAGLLATLCFAAVESRISPKAMAAVEGLLNDKFRSGTGEPYDLLGTARCTYLEGYGALLSVELQLVYFNPPSPFRPSYSPQELVAMRERKLKQLPVLKVTMRNLMASAATTLDSVPGNERISMDVRLWHYQWEDSRGLPARVFMTAEKSKLLTAQANHTDLTTVIVEQEQ